MPHSWDTDPPENHFSPELAARMREVQGIISAGAVATPARTLFVATAWPQGVDPRTCFTDPAAALAAAAAMSPAPDVNNPALIVFSPGRYSQPVTLVSNVHLIGCAPKGCALTGAVTYNPGVGVNASQAGLFERVYVNLIGISGAISIDCTGKTLGVGTTFDVRDVDISGSVTHRGRALAGTQDNFQCWTGVMGGAAWSFDGSLPFFNNGVQLGASTLTLANCAFGVGFAGCVCFSTINLVNTQGVTGSGNRFGDVNVDGQSSFGPVPGGKIGAISVSFGGNADLRGCEIISQGNLSGSSIDRSLWRTMVGPTSVGDNTVSLLPSFKDTSYAIIVTQTAGTPTPVLVSGKQANGFTLTDAVGGNSFDITIVKE